MSQPIAQNALQLLKSANITGGDVPAFVEAHNMLSAIAEGRAILMRADEVERLQAIAKQVSEPTTAEPEALATLDKAEPMTTEG